MDKPLEPTFAFSERALQLTSSAIREILKVTERPEVISFAGGLPAPGGFPVEVVRAAFDKVLSTNGRAALQYGPTEGYAPLRQWVAEDLNRAGANVAADQVPVSYTHLAFARTPSIPSTSVRSNHGPLTPKECSCKLNNPRSKASGFPW